MENRRKIETYLGFCLKAGKATLGVDGIERLKKPPCLLLIDATLGENSAAKMGKPPQTFACPMLGCKESLGDLLHRPACKAAALSEKNLADAVMAEAEKSGTFKLLREVGNGGIQ